MLVKPGAGPLPSGCNGGGWWAAASPIRGGNGAGHPDQQALSLATGFPTPVNSFYPALGGTAAADNWLYGGGGPDLSLWVGDRPFPDLVVGVPSTGAPNGVIVRSVFDRCIALAGAVEALKLAMQSKLTAKCKRSIAFILCLSTGKVHRQWRS